MTDKELRKLSRKELLEMLVLQTRKNEQQQTQIEALEQKLQERQVKMENAGSMAEAILQLNGVFDTAQAAFEQYTENIRRMEKDAEKIILDAKRQANEIIKQANVEASVIIAQARNTATEIQNSAGGVLWKKT